jgi:hypothetical protein
MRAEARAGWSSGDPEDVKRGQRVMPHLAGTLRTPHGRQKETRREPKPAIRTRSSQRFYAAEGISAAARTSDSPSGVRE